MNGETEVSEGESARKKAKDDLVLKEWLKHFCSAGRSSEEAGRAVR